MVPVRVVPVLAAAQALTSVEAAGMDSSVTPKAIANACRSAQALDAEAMVAVGCAHAAPDTRAALAIA